MEWLAGLLGYVRKEKLIAQWNDWDRADTYDTRALSYERAGRLEDANWQRAQAATIKREWRIAS